MIISGSHMFSVVLTCSRRFSVVLAVGYRRLSMVLVKSQWFLVVLIAS